MKGVSEPREIPTVLLTGTVGAGKTAVAEEISTLFYEADVPHAAIDLDWLCQLYPAPPGDPYCQELMFRNLAAVWPHYRDGGARYLILARVLESRGQLPRYEEAVPGAAITVVRVTASEGEVERRLAGREVGSFFDPLWRRSRELSAILDAAGAEDLVVSNDGRPVREVALEVLRRLGWPRPEGSSAGV